MTLDLAADAIEAIAMVCHEANRAYCLALGDDSHSPWVTAPAWQRESVIEGVKKALARDEAQIATNYSARASHDSWLEHKLREGWTYGPTKDPEKKLHPCMLPYDSLPVEQRRKDTLFVSIVQALDPRQVPG